MDKIFECHTHEFASTIHDFCPFCRLAAAQQDLAEAKAGWEAADTQISIEAGDVMRLTMERDELRAEVERMKHPVTKFGLRRLELDRLRAEVEGLKKENSERDEFTVRRVRVLAKVLDCEEGLPDDATIIGCMGTILGIFRARSERLKEELSAAQQSAKEQLHPIDIAPKDGTRFIGIRKGLVFTTWWQLYYDKWPHEEGGPTYKGGWSCDRGDAHLPYEPTHWMPMPEVNAIREAAKEVSK